MESFTEIGVYSDTSGVIAIVGIAAAIATSPRFARISRLATMVCHLALQVLTGSPSVDDASSYSRRSPSGNSAPNHFMETPS
jgi:hypothetical protein